MTFSLARAGLAVAAIWMIAGAAADAASRKSVDLGRLADRTGDKAISVTITLKLRDLAGAEDMMRRVSTPGDPLYSRFMLPAQVQAQFGASEQTVAGVIASLRRYGLTVERTSAMTLRGTGTPTVMERVFQTSLHQFQRPGTDKLPALTFHAPTRSPVIPAEIASAVGTVAGFSNKPVFHSNFRRAPTSLANVRVQWSAVPVPGAASAPMGNPGFLTVADFAARYDVNPLYQQGITGRHRTIGIVTLASFTPSDAFAYWNSVNLNVDPNRLSVVDVDGGPGAPSDESGSYETAADVEQSGGVAPDAKIIVYQAPNTWQGFLDAFAAAIDANAADSISTSWGQWEGYQYDDNGDFPTTAVTDPFSGQSVPFGRAAHELFVVAALQGQSLFAASGDYGAYDLYRLFTAPAFTFPLSVDYPAADTAITAGGGTTLPVIITGVTGTGATITITIPTERVWGSDYLKPVCDSYGVDPITCGIFPEGGGGGVSVFSPVPFYQLANPGVQISQPGQAAIEEDTTPPQTIYTFPAHFRGRNVPDVSFNADGITGYILFYTSDVAGFEALSGGGGTSIVAPQLAGVTALLTQSAGHRLGLLNPLLYGLALAGGTKGPNAVLNTISAGDNWFYAGRNGYSPAAGLGTIDVANLAKRIDHLFLPALIAAQGAH